MTTRRVSRRYSPCHAEKQRKEPSSPIPNASFLCNSRSATLRRSPALHIRALIQTTAKSSFLIRRWPVLLALALLVRGLCVLYQAQELRYADLPGRLSLETGDTKGYLDPIENLIANGLYKPDYRMPGVGAPYWVFRQFLDVGTSRDAMVVLQWALSGLNVLLLALIALRMTGSDRVALLVYTAFLLSANSSWFDAMIASDSLAVSTFILHAFFLQRAVDKSDLRQLFLSGLFLAWFIFLRPVGAALLPFVAILVYWKSRFPRPLHAVFALLLPFLVLDTAWTVRNYRVNHQFSPLTNDGWFPADFSVEIRAHVMHFMQGYGGNYIWWAPGTDIRWFGVWKGGANLDDEGRKAMPPPTYAFVPGYDMDSLVRISERIRRVNNGHLTRTDSLAEIQAINTTMDRYAALYRDQAPLNYHVLSRLRMLKNVLWQHGTEGMIIKPFASLPIWAKLFKLMQVGFYVFANTIGAIAVVFYLWRWRRATTLLHIWLPFAVAYLVLVFPIGLRMCEWRYMAHPFPFALLLGILFLCDRFAARWSAPNH